MSRLDAILDRLRTEKQLAENGGHPVLANSFRHAIEEIERLRLELIAAQPLYSRRQLKAEIERLRAALKEIQAYSVGDPRPRHTWYYDRAEEALRDNEQLEVEK